MVRKEDRRSRDSKVGPEFSTIQPPTNDEVSGNSSFSKPGAVLLLVKQATIEGKVEPSAQLHIEFKLGFEEHSKRSKRGIVRGVNGERPDFRGVEEDDVEFHEWRTWLSEDTGERFSGGRGQFRMDKAGSDSVPGEFPLRRFGDDRLGMRAVRITLNGYKSSWRSKHAWG